MTIWPTNHARHIYGPAAQSRGTERHARTTFEDVSRRSESGTSALVAFELTDAEKDGNEADETE